MAGWLVAGLLLALFVGGAVRIAEARGAWHLQSAPAPQVVTRTDDLAHL